MFLRSDLVARSFVIPYRYTRQIIINIACSQYGDIVVRANLFNNIGYDPAVKAQLSDAHVRANWTLFPKAIDGCFKL
jgi:hypothetical protein